MKLLTESFEKELLRSLKKEIKKNPRKNIVVNESKEKENEVIEEGIKYFKTSIRLEKLAKKIQDKTRSDPKAKTKLTPTVNKIYKLAQKFEDVEDLFEFGKKIDKIKAKLEYEELKKRYFDILEILKKDDICAVMKKVGVYATMIASMTVPYLAMSKFFPQLSSIANIEQSTKFLEKVGLYLKRSGAFILCGLPVTFGRTAINSKISSEENKIIKQVDRVLNSESYIAKEEV